MNPDADLPETDDALQQERDVQALARLKAECADEALMRAALEEEIG